MSSTHVSGSRSVDVQQRGANTQQDSNRIQQNNTNTQKDEPDPKFLEICEQTVNERLELLRAQGLTGAPWANIVGATIKNTVITVIMQSIKCNDPFEKKLQALHALIEILAGIAFEPKTETAKLIQAGPLPLDLIYCMKVIGVTIGKKDGLTFLRDANFWGIAGSLVEMKGVDFENVNKAIAELRKVLNQSYRASDNMPCLLEFTKKLNEVGNAFIQYMRGGQNNHVLVLDTIRTITQRVHPASPYELKYFALRTLLHIGFMVSQLDCVSGPFHELEIRKMICSAVISITFMLKEWEVARVSMESRADSYALPPDRRRTAEVKRVMDLLNNTYTEAGVFSNESSLFFLFFYLRHHKVTIRGWTEHWEQLDMAYYFLVHPSWVLTFNQVRLDVDAALFDRKDKKIAPPRAELKIIADNISNIGRYSQRQLGLQARLSAMKVLIYTGDALVTCTKEDSGLNEFFKDRDLEKQLVEALIKCSSRLSKEAKHMMIIDVKLQVDIKRLVDKIVSEEFALPVHDGISGRLPGFAAAVKEYFDQRQFSLSNEQQPRPTDTKTK